MALFDKAELLGDEKETKARLKNALANKVNAKGTKFLYYEKFKLGSKEVPLVLVDHAPDMQSQVKAKFNKVPSALGQCRVNDSEELVFESDAGHVKLDGLKSFLSSIGVARKVCVSADPAPADAKPKTLDGPMPKASGAPSELTRRLTAFVVQLKTLKAELRDSFETQLKKLSALAAHDEAGALSLLAKLEEMLKKAQSQAGPEVGDLATALAAAKKDVEEALAALPKKPETLAADLQKSTEYQNYAGLIKSPVAIPDVKSLKASASALLKHIELTATQVREWQQFKDTSKVALEKLLTEGLAAVGKPNRAKLLTYKNSNEAKALATLTSDPVGYTKLKELKQAVKDLEVLLVGLIKAIKDWDEAVTQAGEAVDAAIGKLDAEIREAVRKKLAATPEQTAFDKLVDQGKTEVLAASVLKQPADALRDKVPVLGEIEARRVRAAKLAAEMPAKRLAFDEFLKRCNASLLKAGTALDDVAVSFRTATMKNEIDADTLACTNARNTVAALVIQLDAAVVSLPSDPPPPTPALEAARKLLDEVLPDIAAARLRIDKNMNALSPAGREKQVDLLLEEAKSDPLRMLSNNRAGNMAKALKTLKRDEVVARIAAAVAEQHRPKLKEWFKVLQLSNASGGALKLGSVGDITIDRKRIDLHMSLFLANVNVAPSINDPIGNIMNDLLPPVQGNVGTHVTLEVNGAKSQGNPHYFHGAAAGVANDLYGKAEWPAVETEMRNKLVAEMARLRALVQQHIDRKGKWPGE